MQLLLDTQVFLWLLSRPERLGRQLDAVEDPANTLFFSAASSWEIAIKFQIGKLKLPDEPRRFVPERMHAIGANPLPVEHNHALAVCDLPPLHRDPFDRLLVAQARDRRLQIVTADAQISQYDVEILPV